MITACTIILVVSLTGICWTYVGYPTLMLALKPKINAFVKLKVDDLPEIEIIFAAYNEASVIEEKLKSCFNSDYPTSKLKVHVGSDASNDGTDELIKTLQKQYPNLKLTRFADRTGKTGIINQLTQASSSPLLLLTDANIIFTKTTIHQLVSTLFYQKADVVGGNLLYRNKSKKGISQQEHTYLNVENKIKASESALWQAAMGVEGGCYLIKREKFPVIPPTFFMEDFFVSLHVLSKKGKVLFEPKAVVYEDVSTEIKEEYKRKVRISIGNFQNLVFFKSILVKQFFPIGFAFFSHKILRWFTPFLLIFLALSGIVLLPYFTFAKVLIMLYGLFMVVAIIGILFSRCSGLGIIKFPGHFLYMNLALLQGFLKFTKGINSNVWQPTKRNQT